MAELVPLAMQQDVIPIMNISEATTQYCEYVTSIPRDVLSQHNLTDECETSVKLLKALEYICTAPRVQEVQALLYQSGATVAAAIQKLIRKLEPLFSCIPFQSSDLEELIYSVIEDQDYDNFLPQPSNQALIPPTSPPTSSHTSPPVASPPTDSPPTKSGDDWKWNLMKCGLIVLAAMVVGGIVGGVVGAGTAAAIAKGAVGGGVAAAGALAINSICNK